MPRTASGPSCPQEESRQKLPPASRQTHPLTWQVGLRAGSGLGMAAWPLPRVGGVEGVTHPCAQVLSPPPSAPPWTFQQGSPWEDLAGPILTGRATGAPCCSHLSVRPARPAAGALGGQGVTIFYISQASRNHTTKAVRKGHIYLRVPCGPGGGLRAGLQPGGGCHGNQSQAAPRGAPPRQRPGLGGDADN